MGTAVGPTRRLMLAAACCGASALAATLPPTDGVPFNGKTTYAMVKDGGAFDLDAFTLAAWVKVRETQRSQIFLGRGEPGELFTLYLYQGRIRMLVQYAGGRRYTHASVEAPPADTWIHYAGTYDGKQIRIYVNGQPKGTTPAAGRMPRSKAPLYLGALVPGERVLDGWLDDARVWGRVLSPSEIAEVAGRKDVSNGLIARWTKDTLKGERWRNAAGDRLAAVYKANPKVTPRKRKEQPVSELLNVKADGYRGLWYNCQTQDDEYRYVYSGGLGTYCAKHRPFAVYAKEANKTFFCYGGTDKTNSTLLHMVSCYDHATGTVARPTILLDKHTTDGHDNPVISMDPEGYIWIFSSAHGTSRPSYISVSTEPYSVEAFDRVLTSNFSYPQPWCLPGRGFLVPHTIYVEGRRFLHQMASRDGRTWTKPQRLAAIELGHYQITGHQGNKVGTAFNFHPKPKGANWRTNLYYMETTDFGATWHNAQGQTLELPLTEPQNPALVHDYQAKGLNVYLKDLAFDSAGRPVVLHLASPGFASGPKNSPRTWRTARWTGSAWDIRDFTVSDNNYDMGTLRIESDGLWRIIAPTQPGPQRYNTGGEVAMWTSTDQGATWKMARQLTRNSKHNHTYCRKPINAHPGFYAFWADGHGRQPSPSRLYFCDKQGNVFMLPPEMEGDTAKPIPVRSEDP